MADVNSTFKVYISTDPVFKVYVNNGAKGDSGTNGTDGVDGEGVASGGFTGQFLIKLSEEDFDTGWSNIDSTQVSYGDGTVSEGLDNRYTKGETDLLLDDKSNVGHTHDDRYYTETETDTLLNAKSDKLYATNLVTNGDFSNGTTGWNATTSGAIVNGELVVTNYNATWNQSLQANINDVLYISAKLYTVLLSGITGARVTLLDGASVLLFNNPTSTPTIKSAVRKLTNANPTLRTAIFSAGETVEEHYDNIMVLNLTSIFGAGNEPTATEMDALLAKFPNSWFNGTNYLADLSEITKLGNSVIQNATEANAKIEASSTGAVITRNVNDANPALKVNQANASSTGDIAQFQFGGSNKFKVSTGGLAYGRGITYIGDGNMSWVDTASTGTIITRNVADDNVALTVNQQNASSTGNIQEYKFNNVLVGYVDKYGTIAGGSEQTVTNKNKYYPLLKDILGNVIARRLTHYWTGSAYAVDYSNGFGYSALQYNTGANSNGFGANALQNNTGANSNGFGANALQNNTGANSNGFGYSALYNNTGANSNGFGVYALNNNTGVYSNGFGHFALQNNTGASSNGFGYSALYNNTGANSNGFGVYALNNNTGAYSNGFGANALQNNTGAYSNGFGANALRYNQKDNNTVLGHASYGSVFLDNTSGNKVCASSAIDVSLDRVTLTSHGFGATNSFVNIKYASTDGSAIGGLTVGSIYQIKIIDANTIEFRTSGRGIDITSQGSGNHTFTPQYAYTNTTSLGANTSPNKDNQVVLGNVNVDTVKMGGATRTPASATATGVKGEWCWDESYIYVCVATNTWKRTALATW